jgi:hypothetical protein
MPGAPEREKALIDALIEDLNAMFMTELALEYSSSRDGQLNLDLEGSPINNTRLIFVGSSHTCRLASAFKDIYKEDEIEIADLSVPGWKATDAAVETSATLLKETLEEEWDGDTIIFY